jgi:hypothetical protein
VAGFAPSPWDIVVRYGMYRGFGVNGTVAGASVVVGGRFQITFAIVAPVLVLFHWVITGQATQRGQGAGSARLAAVAGAVLLVALILRRKGFAVRIGVLIQGDRRLGVSQADTTSESTVAPVRSETGLLTPALPSTRVSQRSENG